MALKMLHHQKHIRLHGRSYSIDRTCWRGTQVLLWVARGAFPSAVMVVVDGRLLLGSYVITTHNRKSRDLSTDRYCFGLKYFFGLKFNRMSGHAV